MIANEAKSLEKEVNELGPGETVYIPCDVRKEEEIKVSVFYDITHAERERETCVCAHKAQTK